MNTITKEAYEGDIVSRLRNWRGLHLAHSGRLYEEAADEIERLRNGSLERREMAHQEPVVWTVGYGGGGGYFTDDERKANSWRDAGATVTPLYRHPQPTLTDEEREAVELAVRMVGDPSPITAPQVFQYAATLRSLLERLK